MNSTQIEGGTFFETTDEFDGCKLHYVRKQLLEKYPRDETLKSGVPFIIGTSNDLKEFYRVEPGDRIQFRLVLRARLDNATKSSKVEKTPLRRVPVKNVPVAAVRVRDEGGESDPLPTEESAKSRHKGRSFKKGKKERHAVERSKIKAALQTKEERKRIKEVNAAEELPSGVAAWAVLNTHGKLNVGSGYRFCALHVKFVHPTQWPKHIMCARIGLRPTSAYLALRRIAMAKNPAKVGGTEKAKRTSNIVRICSKHGRFAGFAWNGHRRLCKAPEKRSAGPWKGEPKATKVRRPNSSVSLGKIPSDIPVWAYEFKHGQPESNKRFCALHIAFYETPAPWSKHDGCATHGTLPNSACMMMQRPRSAILKSQPKAANVVKRITERIEKAEENVEAARLVFEGLSEKEQSLRDELETKGKEVAEARTAYQKAAGDLTELVKSINSTLD